MRQDASQLAGVRFQARDVAKLADIGERLEECRRVRE